MGNSPPVDAASEANARDAAQAARADDSKSLLSKADDRVVPGGDGETETILGKADAREKQAKRSCSDNK